MTRKKTPQTFVEQHPLGFKLRHTLQGHEDTLTRIAWSPHGRIIASASVDNTVRLWDTETGQLLGTLTGHIGPVHDVVWSPNGKELASGSGDGTIIIWDFLSGEKKRTLSLKRIRDEIRCVSWSPNGQVIASGHLNGEIQLWDMESTGPKKTLKGHTSLVSSVSWSPDSRWLASGSRGGTVGLWNPLEGKLRLKFCEQSNEIFSSYFYTSWSYDGQTLASVSSDGIIRLWDVNSGRLIRVLQGHSARVFCVAFSSDDLLLASKSGDNTVRLWRCDTWETIAVLEEPSQFSAFGGSLAFHPNGQVLATLGENDTIIRIWDLDLSVFYTKASVTHSVHYTNAKAVLVGESGTGKTCLAHALMGEPFKPQESTHGMKIWNFHSETIQRDDGEITHEIMLWDLAGQVDYQVVHQLFLDETVLGIVLFDPTHPENPFGGVGHWDKAIMRVAGEGCPKLLVAGRIDRGHPTVTADDIEAFRQQHGYQRFIATSAKTKQGIEETRESIQQAIPWDKLPVTSSPELWKQIRGYLLNRRSGRYVLTTGKSLQTAFRRQYKGAKFTEADFNTVISHAQAQGLLWRFSFGDHILMKPEILNSYAAAVIRAARKHPQGLGCVIERDVLEGKIDFEDLRRLPREVERKLLYTVVELFLDRELALRSGPTNDLLVFPSKFNRKVPDIPQPPVREVVYYFTGPIEEIYATLVVRLFYSDAFELKDLWKNAAEFYDVRRRICGFELERTEEGEGVISTFFDNKTSLESKVLFSRFIHDHLNRRALPTSVRRERIYRCGNCGEEVKDRRAITVRLERGLKTIPCLYCDVLIELAGVLETEFGKPELLQRVRTLEEDVAAKKGQTIGVTVVAAKETVGEYDVFLAHNSADKPQVEIIGQALKGRGLNPWLDTEQIPPGRWFQDVIQQAIRQVKSAAVVIGQQGLGRWQIMELRAFIAQCVERRIPVIPVLLPGVTEIPAELVFLNELNWVKFSNYIEDTAALDNLQWGITGKHPKTRQE